MMASPYCFFAKYSSPDAKYCWATACGSRPHDAATRQVKTAAANCLHRSILNYQGRTEGPRRPPVSSQSKKRIPPRRLERVAVKRLIFSQLTGIAVQQVREVREESPPAG